MSLNTINLILVAFIISNNLQFLIGTEPTDSGCSRFNVTNGIATFNENYALIQCNENYTLIGGSNITCINGTWPKSLPLCPHKDCMTEDALPVLENGHPFVIVYEGYVLVRYACYAKFKLNGPSSNFCTEGKWNRTHSVCEREQR